MTLEPTLTVERPSPAPERPPGKVPEEIAAEFVVSQIGSNRPQPLNMGSSRGASADRRIMPAATPFSMPEVIRPTPLPKLGTNTAAGAGIRAISEKTKIDSSLIFEDAGEAFVLRTIVAAGTERVTLWSGMEIAKAVFPDLLGRLAKFGFAEFSTLGTAGQGNFDRTTFRSAFQVKNGEWMTLVRVKSASGKDSLVALFSPTSIQMHIPAFHSAGMPGAKAA